MKRDIFDVYATAIAKKFHITLDDMYKKQKTRHCRCKAAALLFMYGETY